jgi:hypothetical protein
MPRLVTTPRSAVASRTWRSPRRTVRNVVEKTLSKRAAAAKPARR